jgi:hypothetical protein
MRSIHKLGIEKRAEAFGRRRQHHVDREPSFHRFAGELFGLELKDRARRQEEKARTRLQSVRAVGVGFGEKDNYGPDESWDTKDPIKYTPAPSYYSAQKSF